MEDSHKWECCTYQIALNNINGVIANLNTVEHRLSGIIVERDHTDKWKPRLVEIFYLMNYVLMYNDRYLYIYV